VGRPQPAGARDLVEMVPSIARIAIECIDALYHNVGHTMLETLAGHDILRSRALHAHRGLRHVIIAGPLARDDANGVAYIDTHAHGTNSPRSLVSHGISSECCAS
jgi:hypothetical protein